MYLKEMGCKGIGWVYLAEKRDVHTYIHKYILAYIHTYINTYMHTYKECTRWKTWNGKYGSGG